MKRNLIIAGLVGIASLLLMQGCGEDYCIAGLGPCRGGNVKETQGGTTGGRLTISVPNQNIRINDEIPVTVTGGTPSYKFEIKKGGGRFENEDNDPNDGNITFIAPSAIDAVIVRVTDSKGKFGELGLFVKER